MSGRGCAHASVYSRWRVRNDLLAGSPTHAQQYTRAYACVKRPFEIDMAWREVQFV